MRKEEWREGEQKHKEKCEDSRRGHRGVQQKEYRIKERSGLPLCPALLTANTHICTFLLMRTTFYHKLYV